MMYLGDFPADQAVYFMWSSNTAEGAAVTRQTDGTIEVYKDNGDGSSYDQEAVTTGLTDDEDVDGLIGIHSCCITTTNAWYETGHDYVVTLKAATIDGQTVNVALAHFSIENRFMRGTNSAALASVVGALADEASDGEVTSADTLMKYVKQLINILVGTPGIAAFPAKAAPANAVSLAEVIRSIHAMVNDGDVWDVILRNHLTNGTTGKKLNDLNNLER